jgi:hypothetical protein
MLVPMTDGSLTFANNVAEINIVTSIFNRIFLPTFIIISDI